MGSHRLVKATEDEDGLAIDRHAHCEITGRPSRFRVEVNHAPHIVVNVVHFNRVRNLLLVKLGAATEYVDVLVIEDATGCGVPRNIKICNPAPSVILDVVFFAGRVETFRIVSTDYEDEASL